MRIKPAAGLKIRDNVSRQLLPADGIDVADVDGIPVDPYWQRLLRDKDVEVAAPAAPAAPVVVEPAADDSHEAASPVHGS